MPTASEPTPKQRRVRAANQRYRQKRLELIVAAKDRPCMYCERRFPTRAMDLHHPTGVHKMTGKTSFSTWSMTVSLERVREELAKCEVLCANCHRIHHWEEKTGCSVYSQ